MLMLCSDHAHSRRTTRHADDCAWRRSGLRRALRRAAPIGSTLSRTGRDGAAGDRPARRPPSPRPPAWRGCRRRDRGGPWCELDLLAERGRRCARSRGSSWSASPPSRQTMSWPVEMPPRMPPAWLVRNAGSPSCMRISSAFSSPLIAAVGEAVADLDALHGVDAHQRLGEVGVELVVDRLAEADRHARGHDLDHRAARAAALAHVVEIAFPALRRLAVGAPEGIVAGGVPVPVGAVDLLACRSGPRRRGS